MATDASALWILRAVFGMATLSFIVAAAAAITRNNAVKRAGLDWQVAAHTVTLKTALPSSTVRVADNYNHLMEAPTVFYAVSLAIVVAGLAHPIYAACAWIFLVARIAHSIVQTTFNKVVVRAAFYAISWLALAVMILMPLPSLF